MREAFRKNKKLLYEYLTTEHIQIVFVVILKGNSVPDYLTIEKSIKEMINKLIALNKESSKVGSQKPEVGSNDRLLTSGFDLPAN